MLKGISKSHRFHVTDSLFVLDLSAQKYDSLAGIKKPTKAKTHFRVSWLSHFFKIEDYVRKRNERWFWTIHIVYLSTCATKTSKFTLEAFLPTHADTFPNIFEQQTVLPSLLQNIPLPSTYSTCSVHVYHSVQCYLKSFSSRANALIQHHVGMHGAVVLYYESCLPRKSHHKTLCTFSDRAVLQTRVDPSMYCHLE